MDGDAANFDLPRAFDLMRRYQATKDPELLYELLQLKPFGYAAPDISPGQLHVMAAAELIERFEQTQQTRYLDKAVDLLREAARAQPEGSWQQQRILADLGSWLHTRFERGGDPADLDEAVEIGRRTVAATGTGHPDRAAMLSKLGTSLLSRADHGEQRPAPDLDEAIDCYRRAVAEATNDHERAMFLTNLSSALQSDFTKTGNPASLDESVDANQRALAALPADTPYQAAIHANLGRALLGRFGRHGEQPDLDQAIGHAQQAVRLLGPRDEHVREVRQILGRALRSRFEWLRDPADLDAAIEQFRLVAKGVPADHAQYSGYVAGLSSALLVRFGESGDMADFSESAAWARRESGSDEADDSSVGERWMDPRTGSDVDEH